VIGGDRGEGNVIGCGGWAVGRVDEGTLECFVAGRCKGCGVWLTAGGVDAGCTDHNIHYNTNLS